MTRSDDSIRFVITENEWLDIPVEKRNRIKALLLDKHGYDISAIDEEE